MNGVHELANLISLPWTFMSRHYYLQLHLPSPHRRDRKKAWERVRELFPTNRTSVDSVPRQLDNTKLLSREIDADDGHSNFARMPDMEPEEDSDVSQSELHLEDQSHSQTHAGLEHDHPTFVPHIEFPECTSAVCSDSQAQVDPHQERKLPHLHPCASPTNDRQPNNMIATDFLLTSIAHDLPKPCPFGPSCDCDKDNEHLLALRRKRQNIVLDSSFPHIVPHIVITPPADAWEDYFTPLQNRVESQWPGYHLTVPPIVYGLNISSTCTSEESVINHDGELESMTGTEVVCNETSHQRRPYAVFSHSRFSQLVQLASTERLIFRHVVNAIYRHHYKALTLMASQKASTIRVRYDMPGEIQNLEKPFQWSDPAEPLLSSCRYYLGTTLLESDSPFSVPHIMITEPPPQNPWVTWHNCLNPQYDTHLSVFSRCTTIGGWDAPLRDIDEVSDIATEDMDPLDGEIPSRPDSPVPDSPPADNDIFHVVLDMESYEIPRCYEGASSQWDEKSPCCGHANAASYLPSMCVFPEHDDDDDNLPPFDDWYTSILQRAKPTDVC